jgi:hypothetical protein
VAIRTEGVEQDVVEFGDVAHCQFAHKDKHKILPKGVRGRPPSRKQIKRSFYGPQFVLGGPQELFIVMTMYNKDDSLFTRTMHGVMKNIVYLCKHDHHQIN